VYQCPWEKSSLKRSARTGEAVNDLALRQRIDEQPAQRKLCESDGWSHGWDRLRISLEGFV
jgi:hypothetical protein